MADHEDNLSLQVKAAIFDAFGDLRGELRQGILEDVDERITSEIKIMSAKQEREHMKTRAFVAVASLPGWGRSVSGVLGTTMLGVSWHLGYLSNLLPHLF